MKTTSLNYHLGLKRASVSKIVAVVVFFVIFNIVNIGAFYKGYSLNIDKISVEKSGIDKVFSNINMPIKIMNDLFSSNSGVADKSAVENESNSQFAVIKTSGSKRMQNKLSQESIYIPVNVSKSLHTQAVYSLDTSQNFNLFHYLCSNEIIRYLLLFLILLSVLPRGIPVRNYNNSYNDINFAYPNFLAKVGFFCFITECKWRLK